tara:strand:+ start:179 stop:667 length:489 start_codon:yes stop_codon:yes gene_type:complete
MSGFKSWNNNDNGSLFVTGGGGNSAGNSNNNNRVQQWSETNTGGTNNIGFLSTNKDVLTTGDMTCVNINLTSDERLKKNINNLDKNEHLDNIKKLIPKSYNFKNESDVTFGLIAQEVEKIYPNLVREDNNGFKSVNYIQLIPLLMLQTKEMERKIEELKNNN